VTTHDSNYGKENFMTNQQAQATVRAVYDGFNAGDVPTLLTLVTDDFELVDVALGMSWHGRQGWGEWLQNWATSLPDARIHLDSMVAEGDVIVTEHTGRGTHNGVLNTPMGAIPPTGKSIELKFAEFFTMRDDKIKTMRAYWDTGTLMRQLGMA
jgi:steroid delta-isomerase-like uncharacterized protein